MLNLDVTQTLFAFGSIAPVVALDVRRARGAGMLRKIQEEERAAAALFSSWAKTALSWLFCFQLLRLACQAAMRTLSGRQMSAPISIRPRALWWLYVLNTLSRLFHLGKTVGGEAKPTFTMFKLYNRPSSVNQGSPLHFPLPCTSLQNCFCQSNIVFFNIHAFPSLTWLSWHSRHNCLPR